MEPPGSEDVLSDSDFESMEQSESGRKAQVSLLKFVADAVGNKLLLAFSRFGTHPMQWGHWLDVLDEENLNTFFKDVNEEKLLPNESIQETITTVDHSFSDSNVENLIPINGIHSRIIAQGVAAYAYAAAKFTGHAEWPLLGPSDVQMLTCEQCSQRFCSSLNYRRHMQTHHHTMNSKKEDLLKQSSELKAYWDKLQPDKARDIVSFDNIMFEGISGDSIIKYLTSFVHNSCVLPLPKRFFTAGASLLELLQIKSNYRCPSAELFHTLYLASEKTFLQTRTSDYILKFIFEGEEGGIGHKIKNLVASIGFLVEQRLVKAWITEKDIESLHLQMELLDEEEAVQRRKAEECERNNLKKAKKKELNKKYSTDVSNEDSIKSLEVGLKDLKDNMVVIDEYSNHPLADTKDASSNKEKFSFEIACEVHEAGHTDGIGTDIERVIPQALEVHSDHQHRKPGNTENLSSHKDKSIVEDAYEAGDASHTGDIVTHSEHRASNSSP